MPTRSVLAPGFYVAKGECWRMVRTNVGYPSHCREPVAWTGHFINAKGRRWLVWSCQEHLEGLADVRPWSAPKPFGRQPRNSK
jgi:hypothetical protein